MAKHQDRVEEQVANLEKPHKILEAGTDDIAH